MLDLWINTLQEVSITRKSAAQTNPCVPIVVILIATVAGVLGAVISTIIGDHRSAHVHDDCTMLLMAIALTSVVAIVRYLNVVLVFVFAWSPLQ